MQYYIIADGENYKIMKMQDEDVSFFVKRYAKQILFEAESIAELLIQFSAKLKEIEEKQE